MNLSFNKKIVVLIIIGLALFSLVRVFKRSENTVSIDYSVFLSMVENESIIEVIIRGNHISGLSIKGPFNTFAPKDPEMIKFLKSKGVDISVEPAKGLSLFRVFLSWFPMLILVGVWIFFMSRMRGGGGNPLSFGKSQASLILGSKGKITF